MTTKQEQWRHKAIAEAPASCKGILERAYSGEASPRQAIKAFCLRCVGYLREEVTNCTSWACPLHPYRPYQMGTNDQTDAEGSEIRAQDASAGSR